MLHRFGKLTWENLTVGIKSKALESKELKILDNVSGESYAGKVYIIMGPSGSGKSTLINTLIGNVPYNFYTSGKILIDDKERPSNFYEYIGFCDQQDSYFDFYSVIDFLKFHSLGRNRNITEKESLERINYLLNRLHLSERRNIALGKLSGGEKKRVMLISELMTDKKIFFLDEPTSGLDSHLALDLFHFLKEITLKNNLMLIITIHQPSEIIVKMFDDFTFIVRGRSLYNGPYSKCEEHLSKLGYVKPHKITFVEFLFELTAGRSYFEEINTKYSKLKINFGESADFPQNSAKSIYSYNTNCSFMVIFSLFYRHLKCYSKKSGYLSTSINLIMYIIYFFVSYFFLKKYNTSENNQLEYSWFPFRIRSFLGAFMVIYSFFTGIIFQKVLSIIFEDKGLIISEISSGSYSLVELAFSLFLSSIYISIIIYFLMLIPLGLFGVSLLLKLFIYFILLPIIHGIVLLFFTFMIPIFGYIILTLVNSHSVFTMIAYTIKSIIKQDFRLSSYKYEDFCMFGGIVFGMFPTQIFINLMRNRIVSLILKPFNYGEEYLKSFKDDFSFKKWMKFTGTYFYYEVYIVRKWFIYAGMITVFIFMAIIFSFIVLLKQRVLIPQRYKLESKRK